MRGLLGARAVVGLVVLTGCAGEAVETDLAPGGPPMVRQVVVSEAIEDGPPEGHRVLAFGAHPRAGVADAHPVTRALSGRSTIRIVVDEVLRGGGLEELACRGLVDDDAFVVIPAGTMPDDIARCAASADALAESCPTGGPRSLCVCQRDEGCARAGSTPVARGAPVGVLDRDQDGVADITRLAADAVAIRCIAPDDPAVAIDVAIDLDASAWSPSGNQRIAGSGFDSLGPALVVTAADGLPPGMTCGLAFSPGVVDHDGQRLCAPVDGDVARGCSPGDTGAIAFVVEPLRLVLDGMVADPGQSRTEPIRIRANAALDPASLAAITVREAAAPYASFMIAQPAPDQIAIVWTAVGGLAAATRYTIEVPATITDLHRQHASQSLTIAFTTGAR